MPAKLYIVHASHPSAAVAKALELKGVPFKVVELPQLAHIPLQRMRFGGRTVPALRFEDGEKVQGSTAILRRLDERAPKPRLFPEDSERRARVEELERWGAEELQPAVRRLAWWGLRHSPGSMPSYSVGSRWRMPAAVTRTVAPQVARGTGRVHGATDEAVRADLDALRGYLDRIDAAIAAGDMGGDPPNAADLQIAASLRLLMTYEDVLSIVEGRPAAKRAVRLFPVWPGSLAAGTLPV